LNTQYCGGLGGVEKGAEEKKKKNKRGGVGSGFSRYSNTRARDTNIAKNPISARRCADKSYKYTEAGKATLKASQKALTLGAVT